MIYQVTVTERAMRLIDEHFGLDYYILETQEIDLDSKFANSYVFIFKFRKKT